MGGRAGGRAGGMGAAPAQLGLSWARMLLRSCARVPSRQSRQSSEQHGPTHLHGLGVEHAQEHGHREYQTCSRAETGEMDWGGGARCRSRGCGGPPKLHACTCTRTLLGLLLCPQRGTVPRLDTTDTAMHVTAAPPNRNPGGSQLAAYPSIQPRTSTPSDPQTHSPTHPPNHSPMMFCTVATSTPSGSSRPSPR